MTHTKLFVQLTLVATAFASTSLADVLPFQWSTTGTFSAPGLPSGLSFVGAGSSAVTNTLANGNLFGINLGHFVFGNITSDYTGTFTLKVNFSRPDGSADPALAVVLVADANTAGGNDDLTINFPAASQYSFAGTDGTGTFTFGVRDVSDRRNGSHTDTVDLIGDISAAAFKSTTTDTSAVPEPSSIVLLFSGLGVVALTAKRKLAKH